ncbi:spermidine synthase [Ottowia beijingensis]|uniref:Spermidine synthase n=1 Tax=Ottowia beijingensis TaxID=1207057 RepID=A0A853IYF6_9BURK|nr:spermidine synthase [Ottowia beijingensis]NZA02658.1 spermidine synthase [Ottowia beijingensis]
MKRDSLASSEVNLSEADGIRYLHLGTEWVQGSMRINAPFDIDLEYVQRMMAWLLFVPPENVAGRHAMQLGLGAAALTKFCYKKLRMTCTAVEINPRVADVCRAWMRLPPEDERLRVVIADAAREIRQAEWLGTVDALQVDLYDAQAAAPVLDSPDFYADCRHLLTDEGCMTVNLFGRTASFERSLESIASAFGPRAVWQFKPTREGNTVVLAQRTPSRPKRDVLQLRAEAIEARWDLPATKWLKVFKALEK